MKSFFTILIILVFSFSGFSHDLGTIKGIVTDAKTGETIIGANLILSNTMLGTSTDIEGKFEFRNLHVGQYSMIISYVGYKSIEKTVQVKSDEITNIHIELEETSTVLDPYAVIAQRPYSAASINYIRKIDLEIRPNKSSQDLLKLVPGLITAQHAGGGKAEQIFLRGFDADHGTDINISVDGIPVNMVSHGHGQGYADLHFLIPEIVEEIDVFKGPYFSQFGNFATAGSVQFKTKEILPDNLIKMEAGSFNTFKGTFLYQLGNGSAEQNGYIATQYYQTDGPFESPMGLQRMNIFGKYFVNLSHNSKLSFSVGSFNSSWDASGQIPERVVKQGIIGRFGAIDELEGGNTSRSNISVQYDQKDGDNNKLSIQAYLSDYDFKLFSNFTYFLENPDYGDMIEQLDNRLLHGMNASYCKLNQSGSLIQKTIFGGGYRADNIKLELWKSPDRIRIETLSDADIKERNLFFWIEKEIIFNSKFRIQGAIRADYFTFNLNDNLSTIDSSNSDLPHASGYSQQGILSPKLNAVYTPHKLIEIFVNFGSGFHSNDARNLIISEKIKELEHIWKKEGLNDEAIDEKLMDNNFDPQQKNAITLPRALGGEIGIRSQLFNRVNIGLAAWYIHLEKEFVYVGDGGYTELSDPTQRIGLDIETRIKLKNWLWADFDFCLSDGKILGVPQQENNIPLAPRFTSAGGLSITGFKGFQGSIRYIYIADRPANEMNTVVAKGYGLLNMGAAYTLNKFTFSITIENLMNIAWNEAQFDTESRMKWESEPISEIHFTPGNPRNIQAGISYKF
jgi:outer membrane receptor protein involved in Fe transport